MIIKSNQDPDVIRFNKGAFYQFCMMGNVVTIIFAALKSEYLKLRKICL